MFRTLLVPAFLALVASVPASAQQAGGGSNANAAAGSDVGIITGTLSYPSDQIPPEIRICAETSETAEITCTDQHIVGTGKSAGTTYRLEVPSGTYKVFAILPEGSTFDPSSGLDYRAYYSEFVTCGSQANCPSHEPIVVEVVAGETVEGIDPNDWYAPN